MGKCRKCGAETWVGQTCHACKKKWIERRTMVFNQAVSELGPLTNDNLKAIQKRIKQLEKKEAP